MLGFQPVLGKLFPFTHIQESPGTDLFTEISSQKRDLNAQVLTTLYKEERPS
jgi:hypothetical protein